MSGIEAIFLGIGAYLVATVSPGPATLAIMAVAARHGRLAGLKLASGVVCGSLFWGLCAAFGLAAVMAQFAGVFVVLKFAGGLYLLWLAFKALRSAWSSEETLREQATKPGNYWLQGLAIHLTNPHTASEWQQSVGEKVAQGALAVRRDQSRQAVQSVLARSRELDQAHSARRKDGSLGNVGSQGDGMFDCVFGSRHASRQGPTIGG